jgi:hypothetical protein
MITGRYGTYEGFTNNKNGCLVEENLAIEGYVKPYYGWHRLNWRVMFPRLGHFDPLLKFFVNGVISGGHVGSKDLVS